MKKSSMFWIIAILIPFSGIAQEKEIDLFYYYKGEKLYLDINTQKALLISNNKSSVALEAKNLIKSQHIDNLVSYTGYQEVYFKNTGSFTRSSHLEIINEMNANLTDYRIEPYLMMEEDNQIRLSNYFYVKLKQLSDSVLLRQKAIEMNVDIVSQNQYMPLWFVLKNNEQSVLDRLTVMNAFYECGMFDVSEPDLIPSKMDLSCANDPLFGEQWNLNNTGQFGATIGIDIKACHAWELSKGRNTVISIVDGGIFNRHPDLRGNIYPIAYDTYRNVVEDSSMEITYYTNYYDSHGTTVAGVAGAKQNEIGVSGVAPECQLMSVAIPDVNAITWETHAILCANGIHFAWQNGADVINNSWTSIQSQVLEDAIDSALIRGRQGSGCIVIFAAGNSESSTVLYPARLPRVIAVNGISPRGIRGDNVPYRDFVQPTNYGNDLDITAPCVSVPTTINPGFNDDYYTLSNGSSLAAPQVSGTVALMLSVNPNLTQQQVRSILESTCTKLANYTFTNNPNHPNSSWNAEVGHGLLNSHAAVFQALFYDKEIIGPTIITSNHEYNLSDRSYPDSVAFSWTSSSNIRIVCEESGQRVVVHGLSLGIDMGWIRLTVSHKGESKTFSKNIIVIGNQSAQTITSDITWQYASPHILTNNVTIENGGRLTINSSQIQCAPDVKFIVKPGGRLILNACTLTNLSTCGKILWQGIEVWGNPSLEQNVTNQGVLQMTGSLIQNAVCGIYVGCPSTTGSYGGACGGGLILAQNSYFYNNLKSVEFCPYEASGSSSYTPPNRSNFTNCNFVTFADPWDDDIDSAFFIVKANTAIVRLYGVRGVRFGGCSFANYKGGHNVSDCGIGIYANNASVTIEGTGFSYPNLFIPSQYNYFAGFGRAIVIKDAGTRASSIKFTNFIGNYVGIYASLVDKLTIESSIIRPITQRNPPLAYAHGVYLEYCDGYTIENNQFIGDGNNGTGLRIDNSGEGNNYVQINTFSDLCLATLASGINGIVTIPNYTGLLYKCNKFSNNAEDIRIDEESKVKFQHTYNNLATGNIFENSTVAVRNAGAPGFGLGYYYNHYYNNTQPNHRPTGYVSNPSGYIHLVGRGEHSCKGIGYMGENYYLIAEYPIWDILENNYLEITNTLEKTKNAYFEKYGNKEINWEQLLESGNDPSDFPQAKLCMEIAGLGDQIQEICNNAFAILNKAETFDRKIYNIWLRRENKLSSDYLLAKSYVEISDWEKAEEVLKGIPERFPYYNQEVHQSNITCLKYQYELNNNNTLKTSQYEVESKEMEFNSYRGSSYPALAALLERVTGEIICLDLDNKCDVVFTDAGKGVQKIIGKDNPVIQDGINNDLISVNIHPNPANNTVFISLDKMPETSVNYQLYDIQGKELQNGNFSRSRNWILLL